MSAFGWSSIYTGNTALTISMNTYTTGAAYQRLTLTFPLSTTDRTSLTNRFIQEAGSGNYIELSLVGLHPSLNVHTVLLADGSFVCPFCTEVVRDVGHKLHEEQRKSIHTQIRGLIDTFYTQFDRIRTLWFSLSALAPAPATPATVRAEMPSEDTISSTGITCAYTDNVVGIHVGDAALREALAHRPPAPAAPVAATAATDHIYQLLRVHCPIDIYIGAYQCAPADKPVAERALRLLPSARTVVGFVFSANSVAGVALSIGGVIDAGNAVAFQVLSSAGLPLFEDPFILLSITKTVRSHLRTNIRAYCPACHEVLQVVPCSHASSAKCRHAAMLSASDQADWNNAFGVLRLGTVIASAYVRMCRQKQMPYTSEGLFTLLHSDR